MPNPKKGESKKDFVKRCIPQLWNNEPDTLTAKTDAKKSKQGFAICNSMYDNRNKKKRNNVKEYNEFVDEKVECIVEHRSIKRGGNPLPIKENQDAAFEMVERILKSYDLGRIAKYGWYDELSKDIIDSLAQQGYMK